MFKNLLNFGYKRTPLEAVGFYIAHLILIMITGVILALILGIATGNQNNYAFGVKVGSVVAIAGSLGLAFLILQKRKLLNNFLYLLVALSAGLLAIFGGGLLGLIPVAYLSTRKK